MSQSITEALMAYLPTALKGVEDEDIPVKWWPMKQKPSADALSTDVIGLIEVVNEQPLTPPRRLAPSDHVATNVPAEVFTHSTGDTGYTAVERDVIAVNSLTGATTGAFVEDTDFSVSANGITWLPGGTLPQDGEQVTMDYDHRMYEQLYQYKSSAAVNIILRVNDHVSAERKYLKSVLAEAVGLDLAEFIHVNVEVPPKPGVGKAPHHQRLLIHRVVSSRAGSEDEGDSVATWRIALLLRRNVVSDRHRSGPTQRIRDVDITGEVESL